MTLIILALGVAVLEYIVYKWERRPEITDKRLHISYKELQKATRCCQEELGSGGSEAVYKGVLDDETRSWL